MDSVGDWSALPCDLLHIIAKLVLSASVEDFMAFRGVCTSWRTAGRSRDFIESVKSWPTVPFLMLPEKEGSDEREFYSLSKSKICMRLRLPEAKGKRCIESRFGWLLTLTCSGETQLLNPFSRAWIDLPNYDTFPEYYKNTTNPSFFFFKKSVLSANPSHTLDFVLVVLTNFYLGFWRNGDKSWTRIETHSRAGAFEDVNCYNEKFYALTKGSQIWFWNPLGADLTVARMIMTLAYSDVYASMWRSYLVESTDGELLLVSRDGQTLGRNHTYGATKLRVFRLVLDAGSCELISSLGEDVIFIGHNASICIRDHAIKPNCIYFSDDSTEAYYIKSPYKVRDELCWNESMEDEESSDESEEEDEGAELAWPNFADGPVVWVNDLLGWETANLDFSGGGGKDMGIYSLEGGCIERFGEDVETLSFLTPPLWVGPFSWLR